MKFLDALIDAYQSNPPEAILSAYDDFMSANTGVQIDDSALSTYANVLEENAFLAGFAAAVELMQKADLVRR